MNIELIREALKIGHKAVLSGFVLTAEQKKNLAKIESAIASLPQPGEGFCESGFVVPKFDQAEFDAMVEKGTKAWAEPAASEVHALRTDNHKKDES